MPDQDRVRIIIEVDESLAKTGVDAINARMEQMGGRVVRMSEASRNSLERLTASVEKQAQAYGKTGVEKLVADRDRLIKSLGQERELIERSPDVFCHVGSTEKRERLPVGARVGFDLEHHPRGRRAAKVMVCEGSECVRNV